jgi:hypothetical protein
VATLTRLATPEWKAERARSNLRPKAIHRLLELGLTIRAPATSPFPDLRRPASFTALASPPPFSCVRPRRPQRAFWSTNMNIVASNLGDHLQKRLMRDSIGSCPLAWCSWRRVTAFAGESRAGQLAIA